MRINAMPLHTNRRRCVGLLSVAATFLISGAAIAQAQPQPAAGRPIRLIVPYVPGGGTDLLSRMLAPYIAEEFGTSVVVENRAGGGSTIGTQAVAKAAPDGLTIGMMDAAFIANPSLMSKLPYDTLKDFAPIVLVATSPLVMVVNPAVPAQNLKEFVAYGKANPGKLSFGSAGRGTGVHLAAEQFRTQAGLDMIHVPFKGTGEAVTALAGGQITTLFTTQFGSKPMLDAGRVRVLGITGTRRGKLMPQVPTFAEAGWPGVDAETINGLVGPAGMPAESIQRVNAAVNRALKDPSVIAKLNEQGFEIAGGSPDAFADWLRREIPKWNRVIRDAGLKAE
jgi:tripartite-type tricarboxylate transporter receptor subunit TctC